MDLLRAVFNHLVLPPRVPGGEDADIEAVSGNVLTRLIRACETVSELTDPPWSEAFRSLQSSLFTCRLLNGAYLDRSAMLERFRDLEQDQTLILHVAKQNAALLIRREIHDDQDCVLFESFETSAPAEMVLAAPHALQWDFPGLSAWIPLAEFASNHFQEGLATFFEQSSMEAVHNLQAQTKKAQVSVAEARDTTHPALITEMLIPLLEAGGGHFQAPVLRKRVRDEVNLKDSELPWRRLPFWLVLRVAAQRQLGLILGNEQGRIAYKLLLGVLLSDLLTDSADVLDPDLTITLRAKLCRRMAKLEMDTEVVDTENSDACDDLFNRVRHHIRTAIESATSCVEASWRAYKETTTRRIQRLPDHAPDHALQLSLSRSDGYLNNALSSWPSQYRNSVSFDLPQPLDRAIRQVQEFTEGVFKESAMESRAFQHKRIELEDEHDHDHDHEAYYLDLERNLNKLLDAKLDSDPEHASTRILAIFTLWVRLDKCAIAKCPLLGKYRPVFSPTLLDALQLATWSDMCRLQHIQEYLERRQSGSSYDNIFAAINSDCLAVRYVSQSADMRDLDSHIQSESDSARVVKETKWKQACAEYDERTENINDSNCRCYWSNGERVVRGCEKCYNWRARNRISVEVHEAFLPKYKPARSAVIFELAIPRYLSAYRDVTWRIIVGLAHPSRPSQLSPPVVQLRDCSPLTGHMTATAAKISLASTIKCFEQTHYKFQNGKVPLDRVVVPFGAKFELYDRSTGLWVKDLGKQLTIQHLCGIHVPRLLRETIYPEDPHPSPEVDGPSSYRLVANQTQCPSNTSTHEFSTYQKLLAGKNRRWINILVELGSSNLNLSSEDTMRLLCTLATQAGPALSGEVLRATHVVLLDSAFLERLAEVIEKHLHAIQSNWREKNYMELLIALGLRLFYLSSGDAKLRAESLIRIARSTTLHWTTQIRNEVQTTIDAGVAQEVATYGLHAALLCRRTFDIHADLQADMEMHDLTAWVQASVALQENLWDDIGKLPLRLKSMLIRDTKVTYRIQYHLRNVIKAHTAGIGDGISRAWSETQGNTSFGPWSLLSAPHNDWVFSSTTTGQESSPYVDVVHFHVLEGHLLVNGKPRGKLPLEISDNPIVKRIFPDRHLLTYPSVLPGMAYKLLGVVEGYDVHFGVRNEEVIIRTVTRGGGESSVSELIPSQVFSGPDGFDLPEELVENCTHWLDLGTGRLEVRRAPAIWKLRMRDWVVDVRRRIATRGNVNLVDPRSELFSRVASIFRNFEKPERLTVFQPKAGRLRVELRHLDLSFYSGRHGVLLCVQLNAEIDSDQDAGTWYGLQSKIVMKHIITGRRSIILPLGKVTSRRTRVHVDVYVNGTGEYASYNINKDLRQISCPSEPRLLYMKALCHAFTSFCLPDPLTGRTGTEEAFHILQSAGAQPYTAIDDRTQLVLKSFEALLPRRKYYPANLKRIQVVTWANTLTTTIQHDGYAGLLHNIMDRSNQLNKFPTIPMPEFDTSEPDFLRTRGEMRRRSSERPWLDAASKPAEDKLYQPRDRQITPRSANVYKIARLLFTGGSQFDMQKSMLEILESWNAIGGFRTDGSSLPCGDPLISQIEDSIDVQWGKLVKLCRGVDHPAHLVFRIGLLAFAKDANIDAIRLLVGFACFDELKHIHLPDHEKFVDFAYREPPKSWCLEDLIKPAHSAFKPEGCAQKKSANRSARERHRQLCEEEGRRLAQNLVKQWPISLNKLSTSGCKTELIDATRALEAIRPEWTRRQANYDLEVFVSWVQNCLDQKKDPRDTSRLSKWEDKNPVFFGRRYSPIIPSLSQELLVKTGPSWETWADEAPVFEVTSRPPLSEEDPEQTITDHPAEIEKLEGIFERFRESSDTLRRQYGDDLMESLTAFKVVSRTSQKDPKLSEPSLETVSEAIEQARSRAEFRLRKIRDALAANDDRSLWLQLGDLWPCTTPTAVLTLLRPHTSRVFGTGMKESLVHCGISLTALQRLERIHTAILLRDGRVLGEELLNPGHENWTPLQRPEWLLMEIDGDLLIRPEQADVALAILAPKSGKNSVLQMNMGKGKTSCIVPMVAAILANGKDLARLIVPKTLLKQTAQAAQSRLGGLIGCEILHIPFSRKTRTTSHTLELYAKLQKDTLAKRGLVITCHEHLLSHKLGGWQHLADNRLEAARCMIEFQNWLDKNSRDVLDECDYTLSVKTQLNYPSGPEMVVDGHPFRWLVAEGLLSRVARHVSALQGLFPGSIEVLQRPGSFPRVHFLRKDARDALHSHILSDIAAGRVAFLRPTDSTLPNQRKAIVRALSEEKFDRNLFSQAVNAFANPQEARKIMLVVRGLLVNKILLLCLDKRWNVQYGLHPHRHPIAVPFEAKGTPSEQSEFGHPDVAILLTCLAFYYTGLTQPQFRQGLQHVLQSDNPAAGYDRLTSGCDGLPEPLRNWNIVNVEDNAQLEELWQHLRMGRAIIDHYMNHFVFPAHAKQFEIKLQASGWDIPLLIKDEQEQGGARTTGFSGTNDNRRMLPLTIQQDDLPGLHHTSAEVLSYLLQPRNREYYVAVDKQYKRLSETGLLRRLNDQKIRVLIDAGAYILEMDNKTVIKTWMGIDTNAKAGVYFNNENRLYVHFRGKTKDDMPLLATPFAENMEECVVYLDEAHTRGVDLKLPTKARGALTLALKQTKDFTVQAAMRLRQLRTTQSVSFFAPPEVDQSIRDFCHANFGEKLDSSHVISWLLEQTCLANETLQGLYIAQGVDFCRRTDAVWSHSDFLTKSVKRERVLKVLRQQERLTLEQLYGGGPSESSTRSVGPIRNPRLQSFSNLLAGSGRKYSSILADCLEEVEQEREVQVQVEQVRQVQKPIKYEPKTFPGLHPDISWFVKTGFLDLANIGNNCGYERAFGWIATTGVGRQFGVREKSSQLWVSREFGNTIQIGRGDKTADNFLRPVEWILWSPRIEAALVIIPEEAELILPEIRSQGDRKKVWLVAYAAPTTNFMQPFNSLDFYIFPQPPANHKFPAWLHLELGIVSGRLYIGPDESDMVRKYLGCMSEADEEIMAGSEGGKEVTRASFADNPAAFVLEWVTVRRKTQDVLHTPIGHICTGRIFEEKDVSQKSVSNGPHV